MQKLKVIILAALFVIGCKAKKVIAPTEIAAVSYTNTVESVISKNCKSCHSGSKPAAELNLTTYEGVKSAGENGALVDRINNVEAPMPPNGLMDEEKRKAISSWVEAGYLAQ